MLTIIQSLKNVGISISLDDFGTGYASLAQLHTLPVDRIKIDKSFIATLVKSEQTAAIVATIANLGHTLNVPITAEGVESEQIRSELKKFGCSEAQGWLFGRAVSAETVRTFLEMKRAGRRTARKRRRSPTPKRPTRFAAAAPTTRCKPSGSSAASAIIERGIASPRARARLAEPCPRTPSKLRRAPSGGRSISAPAAARPLASAYGSPAWPAPGRAFFHGARRVRTPRRAWAVAAVHLTRSACEGPPWWRPRGRPDLITKDTPLMATTTFPTRDDFAAMLNESLGGENETFEGKVVKGIVTAIENDLAVIDVGLKSRRPGRAARVRGAGPEGRIEGRRRGRGLCRPGREFGRRSDAVARPRAPRSRVGQAREGIRGRQPRRGRDLRPGQGRLHRRSRRRRRLPARHRRSTSARCATSGR